MSDIMSESQHGVQEAVRQVFEFGVTGDGELHLGLDAAAARPARKGTPLPPAPVPGDGWADHEAVLDSLRPDGFEPSDRTTWRAVERAKAGS